MGRIVPWKDNRGSLLLEAVVAALLAGLLVLPLLQFLLTLTLNRETTSHRTEALALAESRMEWLWAHPPQDCEPLGMVAPVPSGTPGYRETVDLWPDPSSPHLCGVKVMVTWNNGVLSSGTVSLVSTVLSSP